MLRAFGQTIFLERRRLVFVSVMAFLAGFLFYLNTDVYLHGVHVSLVTGCVYAGVVGTASLLICVFLPSLRFMIEAVAVSRLGLSLFVLAMPQLGAEILASPMLTAFLVVTGGALVSRLLHGQFHRERRGWVLPSSSMIRREPARLRSRDWQFSFVSWMDDTVPIRA